MDLATILPHLNERRAAQLPVVVEKLETAIAAGVVPNTLFTEAKDLFNRVVEKGAEAFLATGPRTRDGGRGMSDWWHAAYEVDAFVHYTNSVPTAIKRAAKVPALAGYVEFLNALLPLHAMLQAAKPLIAKRGDGRLPPPPKTAAQLEREARQMTCQCCGRLHLANTGTIAHHGYQRPGGGWQTASCSGAKNLPFEVSRDTLGHLIEGLRNWEAGRVETRAKIEAETLPVVVIVADKSKPRDMFGRHPSKRVELTRSTDAAATGLKGSFDDYKANNIRDLDHEITGVRDEIKTQQARFDGWKQTHKWDAATKEWKVI